VVRGKKMSSNKLSMLILVSVIAMLAIVPSVNAAIVQSISAVQIGNNNNQVIINYNAGGTNAIQTINAYQVGNYKTQVIVNTNPYGNIVSFQGFPTYTNQYKVTVNTVQIPTQTVVVKV
jgi:hypothetical protein